MKLINRLFLLFTFIFLFSSLFGCKKNDNEEETKTKIYDSYINKDYLEVVDMIAKNYGKNEKKYDDFICKIGGISFYEQYGEFGIRESQRILLKVKKQDALTLYYIGLTYFRMHDFGNAVLYFEKSLSKKEEFEYKDKCMRFLAYSYYYLEKFDLLFDSPLTKNDDVIKFFSFIIKGELYLDEDFINFFNSSRIYIDEKIIVLNIYTITLLKNNNIKKVEEILNYLIENDTFKGKKIDNTVKLHIKSSNKDVKASFTTKKVAMIDTAGRMTDISYNPNKTRDIEDVPEVGGVREIVDIQYIFVYLLKRDLGRAKELLEKYESFTSSLLFAKYWCFYAQMVNDVRKIKACWNVFERKYYCNTHSEGIVDENITSYRKFILNDKEYALMKIYLDVK